MEKRACFPVRMRPSDHARIASAAKAQHLSMCAFMVKAALEAAGQGALGAETPSEAISALRTLGYDLGDAKRAVRRFCEAGASADGKQESLTTQEIILGVLKAKGEALCQ